MFLLFVPERIAVFLKALRGASDGLFLVPSALEIPACSALGISSNAPSCKPPMVPICPNGLRPIAPMLFISFIPLKALFISFIPFKLFRPSIPFIAKFGPFIPSSKPGGGFPSTLIGGGIGVIIFCR